MDTTTTTEDTACPDCMHLADLVGAAHLLRPAYAWEACVGCGNHGAPPDPCDETLGPELLPGQARVSLTIEAPTHARWYAAAAEALKGDRSALPAGATTLLGSREASAVLPDDEAYALWRWAASLPGWDEGVVRPVTVERNLGLDRAPRRVRYVRNGALGTVLNDGWEWVTVLWDSHPFDPADHSLKAGDIEEVS